MDTDTPAIFGGVWDLHVVEVVEEMSWILCDRLMPQKNTDVLVSDGYDAYIALWDGYNWQYKEGEGSYLKILMWMNIPEPPKPESKREEPEVLRWEISKYPTHCRKCPFYHEVEYWDHNDRGDQGICDLGYNRGHDTRDRTVWEYCEIRTDQRVICHEREEQTEPIQIPEDELGI